MWKITKDHIAEPTDISRVGVSGDFTVDGEMLPTYTAETDVKFPALPMIRFKMFDDDGELYYEGELHDDPECLNQLEALRFGATDAGCTTIKVERDGEWKQEIA